MDGTRPKPRTSWAFNARTSPSSCGRCIFPDGLRKDRNPREGAWSKQAKEDGLTLPLLCLSAHKSRLLPPSVSPIRGLASIRRLGNGHVLCAFRGDGMSRCLALGVCLLTVLAIDLPDLAATPNVRVVVDDATYLISHGRHRYPGWRGRKCADSHDIEKEVNGKTLRKNSVSVRTIAAAITRTEILEKRRALEHDRPRFTSRSKSR